MLPIADFSSSLRAHNARALDQVLLERFGGRVGRGLALERSRRRDVMGYRGHHGVPSNVLFAPALIGHTGADESAAETGDNAGAN